ncbi:hypothetical protein H5410_052954 [Solanum commersonii]|uniref:Uncharacterized protein n=1 Tax=Solanum commersonii TaxID=4109 RepID=A0A9J5X3L8_SOLCO|nr:hypothetical protein H5410_052954 [Solanum commersonii]
MGIMRECWISHLTTNYDRGETNKQSDKVSLDSTRTNTKVDNLGVLPHSTLSNNPITIEHATSHAYTPFEQLCELFLATNSRHVRLKPTKRGAHKQRGRRQHGGPSSPGDENEGTIVLYNATKTERRGTKHPRSICSIYLNNPLTLEMLPNIKRKFLIKVPREVNKITMT